MELRRTSWKRHVVRLIQRYFANPIMRRCARYIPGQAVLETTGRRTGFPRRTPVGGRLEGSSFWIVSEYGHRCDYVRNVAADPRVRVQVRGRWLPGTAHLLDADDPRQRLKRLPLYNGLIVRLVGTDLLSIRVDLDPGG